MKKKNKHRMKNNSIYMNINGKKLMSNKKERIQILKASKIIDFYVLKKT